MFRSLRRPLSPLCRRLPLPRRQCLPHANCTTTGSSDSYLTILGAAFGFLGATLVAADQSPPTEFSLRPTRRSYKYLICGGGIAAQEALRVFVEHGEASNLLLVSPEWRNIPIREDQKQPTEERSMGIVSNLLDLIPSLLPLSFARSQRQPPEIVIGPKVASMDTSNRTATLDDGMQVTFERCLIAVGSSMPDIPLGKVVSGDAARLVSGAQSSSDWRHIDSVIRENYVPAHTAEHEDSRAHVTVVGGGWMSPIVGATLVERGADVTFSYAEPSFLARYFPKYLAQDVYNRLQFQSAGGVDSLSYSAVRYVVARKPLDSSGDVEAEVHVGTVFDAFSIVDFRTDHVLFAPTLPSRVPLDAPNLIISDGGFVANPELAVASDVYVAGAAAAIGSGAVECSRGMRWSADHAKATGRHAAMNMLGAREVYDYSPTLTVDLSAINLRVHVLGDVDGSTESFGYFQRDKARGEDTCGGALEKGVLFCVSPAPLTHRGASQKLSITGVALWEGSAAKRISNLPNVSKAGLELLEHDAMTRPELEAAMDAFAMEQLQISLFQAENESSDHGGMPRPAQSKQSLEKSSTKSNVATENDGAHNQEVNEVWLRPLASMQKPSPGVIWRRHRSARAVRIRPDELLWIENDWVGAVSPESTVDRVSQAYADLLRRSAGKA